MFRELRSVALSLCSLLEQYIRKERSSDILEMTPLTRLVL
jgi:hypothetical protein